MHVNFSTISENLAHTFGDAECLVNVERNRRYSFREYHRLTNQIANMMRGKLDLRRGDICVTILDNDNSSLLSFFTACKCEAIIAYTNVVDSLADQAQKLDFLEPKVVFIEASLLPTHYPLLAERGLTVVSMDPPPPGFPKVLHFWDLLAGASEDNPDVQFDDRADCVALRFTGGTTGTAKAVMYCLDNWMANRDAHYATPDALLHGRTRFLHFGLISHASGILLFPVMFKGGCTLTMNDRSLLTWCNVVAQERVTGSMMLPSMLYRLLESPAARSVDLSSLEVMIYGGTAILPTKLQELQQHFGNIFVQVYAASENAGATTVLSLADHAPRPDGSVRHLMSAGKVVPGSEMQIRDASGRPVPVGCNGELWLKSRATSMGYWKNPEKTAEEFCDGYWKSGDAGRMDEQGFVYLLDRVKDTFVSRGATIYPSQIEAIVCAHPKVKMAAVVGIPDGTGGDWVHAEVVPGDGETLTEGELRAFLHDKLAAADIPQTIGFAPDIAMSPVGKVLRRQVRDACRERLLAQAG
jgi:acyl-CoA synthetase (AMP-forming)/AMP-acid ligase II